MRMLLVLISFAGLAACTPLVGKNECSWGPAYWCSYAKNAKACGAVQHCLDTVWSKQTISEDPQPSSCSLCKMVVKETRKMLKNKSTDKIVDFFSMACQFMPDENLKKECNFLASDSEILINLMRSDISDGQLCAAVKQCKGFEDRTHEIPSKVPELPGNTTKICVDCVAFFGDIKQMIYDNATIEQVKDLLKNVVCTQLASSEGLCDFIVDELVPELLQVLGGEVEPQVLCNMLSFCQGTDIYKALVSRIQFRTELKKINKAKIGGVEECDMCKEVMTKVRDMDRDPANQEKVKNFIKTELCEKLGTIANECKTAVDEYGGILFELIASELDPTTVCTMLGFCKSSTYVAAKPIVPALQVKPKVEAKAGELCDLCQMAINELDSMITKNSTTQEIEQALASLCDRLPAQYKDACNDFVKQYAPAILDIIGQELDPVRVCTLLKLCTSGSKRLDMKKPEQSIHSTTECLLCEMVMKEIDNMLQGSKVKEDIENALKSVCNRLSSAQLSKECTSFVMQYTEMLVDLLVQMPPKQVCTTLGLCTAAKMQAKQELHHVKLISTKNNGLLHLDSAASIECVVCEYVMSEVDDILKENRSKQAIENALQMVCSRLPTTISKECSDFVNQYADLVINLLIAEGDPKTVCRELKLCQASDVKTSEQHKAMPMAASVECVVCEFVMREVDNILQQNRSRQAIENALQMVCSRLPSTISKECSVFVNQYADLVISLLINEGDPKTVCTVLKLCSADLKKALLDSMQFLPIPGQVAGVKLGDEKCEVCEMVLNYLDEALKENKTVAAVEALLDQVCNFLPTTFKEECNTLVAQYGPVIAELIAQLVDPKKICEEIKLCPSKSHVKQSPIHRLIQKLNQAPKDTKLYFKSKQHLLGEKECTYGPSYWCASPENAKKCQAEEHCRTKVWNQN